MGIEGKSKLLLWYISRVDRAPRGDYVRYKWSPSSDARKAIGHCSGGGWWEALSLTLLVLFIFGMSSTVISSTSQASRVIIRGPSPFKTSCRSSAWRRSFCSDIRLTRPAKGPIFNLKTRALGCSPLRSLYVQ